MTDIRTEVSCILEILERVVAGIQDRKLMGYMDPDSIQGYVSTIYIQLNRNGYNHAGAMARNGGEHGSGGEPRSAASNTPTFDKGGQGRGIPLAHETPAAQHVAPAPSKEERMAEDARKHVSTDPGLGQSKSAIPSNPNPPSEKQAAWLRSLGYFPSNPNPPSEKQAAWLRSLGYSDKAIGEMSKGKATDILGEASRGRKR